MKIVNKYMLKYVTFLLFSFFLLIVSAATPKHAYHVSVTQMQYNAAEKSLEVSIRIFTDDLERTLSENNNMRRFVITNNDQNNSYVEKYIKKNFVITDKKQQVRSVKFLGKEEEADATWVYLEVPLDQGVEGAVLTNSILLDVFADQVNMTNLKYNATKKTYLFKKGQTTLLL